jgi:hypothetical protein
VTLFEVTSPFARYHLYAPLMRFFSRVREERRLDIRVVIESPDLVRVATQHLRCVREPFPRCRLSASSVLWVSARCLASLLAPHHIPLAAYGLTGRLVPCSSLATLPTSHQRGV